MPSGDMVSTMAGNSNIGSILQHADRRRWPFVTSLRMIDMDASYLHPCRTSTPGSAFRAVGPRYWVFDHGIILHFTPNPWAVMYVHLPLQERAPSLHLFWLSQIWPNGISASLARHSAPMFSLPHLCVDWSGHKCHSPGIWGAKFLHSTDEN